MKTGNQYLPYIVQSASKIWSKTLPRQFTSNTAKLHPSIEGSQENKKVISEMHFLCCLAHLTGLHVHLLQLQSIYTRPCRFSKYLVVKFDIQGPCIVMYSYTKNQRDTLISQIYFSIKLYMFRTGLLSIISSLVLYDKYLLLCTQY